MKFKSIRRIVAASFSALVMIFPTIASAHAVVYPKASKQGGYEKYVLRVPNEKDAATTRIEIRFPADMRITSFTDVPGWQLEIQRDSAKRIVGAVWTGILPPERFVELPFVAANPKKDVSITWPAFQTYASGERVDWVGPVGSKHPASVTQIGSDTAGNPKFQLYGTIAALLMSFIALGLALRRAP